MHDAWRAYLELAMGLTEAPRKKAQDAVRRLVGTGGATAAQLQSLAEELVATSAANREALTKLVRFEVDRALSAVGLATADEVGELTRRVRELERELRETRAAASVPTEPVSNPPGQRSTTVVAKKAVAKKTVAKKTPGAVSRAGSETSGQGEARRPGKKSTPAGASAAEDGPASGGAE